MTMKGTIISVREKNTYRIRRIRAFRKYFWVVQDIVKGCFLHNYGGWFNFVTFKFPLVRDGLSKSEILLRIPGYFSSKKEAISCLERSRRR